MKLAGFPPPVVADLFVLNKGSLYMLLPPRTPGSTVLDPWPQTQTLQGFPHPRPPAPTQRTILLTLQGQGWEGEAGWKASQEGYPYPTPFSLLLSILSGVHKARRTLARERGVGVRQTGQGGSWLKFNHNILGLYCFE